MKQINVKKLLLPNIPYVFIALFATKLGQAARLAPGADFSQKALHIMEGFAAAFQSALPSFHPIDLCVGIAAALLIRLAVYVKGKNARKFRKNIEYGSARWGNAEDIKPYVDPTFANNVILTQTERLTMNSRPKDPKTARNKNRVLPLPEPPTTSTLLLRAVFGSLGRLFMVSRSVWVRMTLLAKVGST